MSPRLTWTNDVTKSLPLAREIARMRSAVRMSTPIATVTISWHVLAMHPVLEIPILGFPWHPSIPELIDRLSFWKTFVPSRDLLILVLPNAWKFVLPSSVAGTKALEAALEMILWVAWSISVAPFCRLLPTTN